MVPAPECVCSRPLLCVCVCGDRCLPLGRCAVMVTDGMNYKLPHCVPVGKRLRLINYIRVCESSSVSHRIGRASDRWDISVHSDDTSTPSLSRSVIREVIRLLALLIRYSTDGRWELSEQSKKNMLLFRPWNIWKVGKCWVLNTDADTGWNSICTQQDSDVKLSKNCWGRVCFCQICCWGFFFVCLFFCLSICLNRLDLGVGCENVLVLFGELLLLIDRQLSSTGELGIPANSRVKSAKNICVTNGVKKKVQTQFTFAPQSWPMEAWSGCESGIISFGTWQK